jgi:EXLDI family protein
VLRGDVFPGGDATLDVYATLDELTANVPPELGDIVREAEQEPEVETLDI